MEWGAFDERRFPRRRFMQLSAVVAGSSALGPLGLNEIAGASLQTQSPASKTLITVAHADDNLLFMCPDELTFVANGGSVWVVYLTTGDAGLGQAYWESREHGAQAAAVYMTGRSAQWTSRYLTASGHVLPMATLKGTPNVSLIFMRLPDGGSDGNGYTETNLESLMKLWTKQIPSITSADGDTYTTTSLVKTLAAIIKKYQPGTIFTQNFNGSYNTDHSDHVTTGLLTKAAALSLSPIPFTVYAYEGYPVSNLPANVSGSLLTAKENTFEAYAQYDSHACYPISQCFAPGWYGATYGSWLPRQYEVAEIPVGT